MRSRTCAANCRRPRRRRHDARRPRHYAAGFRPDHGGPILGMHWIWLIFVGALVGALGRLHHLGRDPMGWIVTILIGIASLVIAGLIFNGFWAFVVGVIVEIVLVALVGRFFFFQAEDGIRGLYVTGVQTCALPIWIATPSNILILLCAGGRESRSAPCEPAPAHAV